MLDGYFEVWLHFLYLLLQSDNQLDVLNRKVLLVRHQELVGTVEILLELIEKSLPRNLNANAKDNLRIYNLFFEGRV